MGCNHKKKIILNFQRHGQGFVFYKTTDRTINLLSNGRLFRNFKFKYRFKRFLANGCNHRKIVFCGKMKCVIGDFIAFNLI